MVRNSRVKVLCDRRLNKSKTWVPHPCLFTLYSELKLKVFSLLLLTVVENPLWLNHSGVWFCVDKLKLVTYGFASLAIESFCEVVIGLTFVFFSPV